MTVIGRLAEWAFGTPPTILGQRAKAAAPWAALVNGAAAHALDYDDNFGPGVTHASAVLIPALLALGEEIDASGRQLLDAYIVGLEMHAAVGGGLASGKRFEHRVLM